MACFYATNRFQHSNFETNFVENEHLFQETSVPLFSWKYYGWKRTTPCKTSISEANVKTNRMMSSKWTYHKNRFLPVTTSFFLKILYQFKMFMYQFMYQLPKCPYSHFLQALEFYTTMLFPMSIHKIPILPFTWVKRNSNLFLIEFIFIWAKISLFELSLQLLLNNCY